MNFLDKNYVYTRLELVDKNELLRASDRALLGITDDHPAFRIGGYTVGARDIWRYAAPSCAAPMLRFIRRRSTVYGES